MGCRDPQCYRESPVTTGDTILLRHIERHLLGQFTPIRRHTLPVPGQRHDRADLTIRVGMSDLLCVTIVDHDDVIRSASLPCPILSTNRSFRIYSSGI